MGKAASLQQTVLEMKHEVFGKYNQAILVAMVELALMYLVLGGVEEVEDMESKRLEGIDRKVACRDSGFIARSISSSSMGMPIDCGSPI